LWRGSQLAAAREWASGGDNRASLPALETEFIDASIAEESARQRADQLRAQWLYGSIVLATALMVVAAGLTIYVLRQRRARAAALDVRQ
jgi:hypothetical protein